MSSKTIKIIRPYRREPINSKSLEGSLYKEGLNFIPGCEKRFFPRFDSRGFIKTGLDENSIRIKNIQDESIREQEYKRVKALREHYESLLGEPLTPDSAYYESAKENGYTLVDADNVFDLNDPEAAANFYWLTESDMIAKSVDDIESGRVDLTIVKFYIHDSDIENEQKFTRKKRINEAKVVLDGLAESERRKIAKLLGLGIADTASERVVYNAIDDYLNLKVSSVDKDPVEAFRSLTTLSPEILDVKSLVLDLIKYNIVRVKGGVVLEGQTSWAKSVEEFELILVDPQNADTYDAFRDKLQNKIQMVTL